MSFQCLTPITLFRKTGTGLNKKSRSDVVPCGKCPNCVKRRSIGWVFRLKEEHKVSQTACFLTLTYEDEKLPITKDGWYTLDKRHLQLFMKRLRKSIKDVYDEEYKIRYYAVGEYGSKFGRPHYHYIMFNLPKDIIDASYVENRINRNEVLEGIWTNGHIDVGTVTEKSIAYVSGYCHKTLYNHPEDIDVQKEFSLMSKGIGKAYLTDSVKKYYQNKKIPYLTIEEGQKHIMPRYYKDKLYTKAEKSVMAERAMEAITQKYYGKKRVEYIENVLSLAEKRNKQKRKIL